MKYAVSARPCPETTLGALATKPRIIGASAPVDPVEVEDDAAVDPDDPADEDPEPDPVNPDEVEDDAAVDPVDDGPIAPVDPLPPEPVGVDPPHAVNMEKSNTAGQVARGMERSFVERALEDRGARELEPELASVHVGSRAPPPVDRPRDRAGERELWPGHPALESPSRPEEDARPCRRCRP